MRPQRAAARSAPPPAAVACPAASAPASVPVATATPTATDEPAAAPACSTEFYSQSQDEFYRELSGASYTGGSDAPIVFKLGAPATLEGARATLCPTKRCHVVMMLPAGSDPDTGDPFFVARVEWGAQVQPFFVGCMVGDAKDKSFVGYFLVVAHHKKIARAQYLLDSGDPCMHEGDEEISVGPNVFSWLPNGYGAPGALDPRGNRLRTIELATLRVDGCASRRIDPGRALVQHGW